MPLIQKLKIEPEGTIGIWKTKEDDDFFYNKLNLFPEEFLELNLLKDRKRTEWLSSRYLLHLLSERNERMMCLKDEFGKPYLRDSFYHISISHSGEYTGVIAAPKVVGIDIQIIVPKIIRILPKFVSEEEYKNLANTSNIESFHTVWGAKEAMYKAYGRKAIDFKKQISVGPFTFDARGFTFDGQVKKDEYYRKYTLFCRQIENLILVYAIEK